MFADRERTATELRALFEQAGLTLERVISTSTEWSVTEGTRLARHPRGLAACAIIGGEGMAASPPWGLRR